MKFKYENWKFNIEGHKDNPSNIAFYTGITDFETLMLCFKVIEDPKVSSIGLLKDIQRHASEMSA